MSDFVGLLDDTTPSSDAYRRKRGSTGSTEKRGGVADDEWGGSLGGDDDVEYVDDDGWFHPGGGAGGSSGGSRGYMGRGAEGSGWDWTGLNDTPQLPLPISRRHGHGGITDRTPATGKDGLFPSKGKASSTPSDPFATAGSTGSGDRPDLPLTAGRGKFSQQNVRNRAFLMPAVRDAMRDGRQVMLIRNITVNRQRVRRVEELSRGMNDDNPMYVTFSGDFNADGSQARGRQARMENSDECDCSTTGSSGAGGGGGGGGGTGSGPSGGGSTGGGYTSSGSGTVSDDVTDGSEVTDTTAVTNSKPATQSPYTWEGTGGGSVGKSPAPVQTYNPAPTYTPPEPPYQLPPKYTTPYDFTKNLLPAKIDKLGYHYPIIPSDRVMIDAVDENTLLKTMGIILEYSKHEQSNNFNVKGAQNILNAYQIAQLFLLQNKMAEARDNMNAALQERRNADAEKYKNEYEELRAQYLFEAAFILAATAFSELGIAKDAYEVLEALVPQDLWSLIERRQELNRQLNPNKDNAWQRKIKSAIRELDDIIFRRLNIKRNNDPIPARIRRLSH